MPKVDGGMQGSWSPTTYV